MRRLPLVAIAFVACTAMSSTSVTSDQSAESHFTVDNDDDGDGAVVDGQKAGELTKTLYEDAFDYLDVSGGDIDGFVGLRGTLTQNFNDICGDTFCGSDYDDLQALTFTCSVSSKLGVIHACVWTFAGSYMSVTPSTGTLTAHAKTFACKISVGSGTTIKQLMTLLTAAGSTQPIDRILPGETTSIYDAIGTNCLP